ncbi:TonB-dependent receptor plug domain-containing protein [Ketobacter sp.]
MGATQPGLANDDQETHPAKTKMEQVVVTANRAEKPLSTIPNTVTVIDDDELDQQININPDLSTTLGNMIPSFAPSRQKLTGYGETLRGRDPLYLVDGVPQSNPLRDGSRDGYTIDPLMLERVEVLHGATYRLNDNWRVFDIYSVAREKTEIDGIELVLNWFASEVDTVGLRSSFIRGEYDSDNDGTVDSDLSGANMSPNRLNLSWDRIWTDLISTRLQMNHVYNRNFKDPYGVTETSFEGYTTVDLNSRFDLETGSIQFSIQNLTNTDYYTYYSQTLGNNARNFKGLGRSYTLSYSLRF